MINPTLTKIGAGVGAAAGGALAGYAAGKYNNRIAKEVAKTKKLRWDETASKEQEVAYNRAYAKADFREAFKTVKKSGYFDDFPQRS